MPLWAQSFGGTASEVVMSATPYNNASLYCTGYFASTGAVYGGFSLTTTGSFDVSVFKINLPAPLPVELMSFSVAPVGIETALCKWITESETNNDFFTLEKSSDGISFYFLAKVAGSNTSSLQHKYAFDDLHPYSGTSYYRLTQTDFNGASKMLKMVALNMPGNQKSSFQCYFNESDHMIIIHGLDGNMDINVYDLNGHQAASSYCITGSLMPSVPANDFSSGIYVVRVNSGEKLFYQKVLIP